MSVRSIDMVYRNNRAVGIEYIMGDDAGSCANTEHGKVYIARATRLVVVSAGALGSPSILERSGIGASAVLKKAGVEQIVDLPGVGENYNGMREYPWPYFPKFPNVDLT